jgi:hypothetical protein
MRSGTVIAIELEPSTPDGPCGSLEIRIPHGARAVTSRPGEVTNVGYTWRRGAKSDDVLSLTVALDRATGGANR